MFEICFLVHVPSGVFIQFLFYLGEWAETSNLNNQVKFEQPSSILFFSHLFRAFLKGFDTGEGSVSLATRHDLIQFDFYDFMFETGLVSVSNLVTKFEVEFEYCSNGTGVHPR